ncbi:hypothetical protein JNW88_22270 [Micromonospora sp. ATA32]|nr:hypothetical protein [Micromonospora sp. ATA32]
MLLSSEGEDPMMRPTLEVTYLEQAAESTYYAASTPQLTTPNATYTVLVTVSNPTLAAWNTTDWELSYDWKRPEGLEDATDDSFELKTPLPKNIPAGGTVDITAQVKTPPSSTDGNERTDYVLQWDLRSKLDGKRLSASSPIKPLPQNVAVEEPTSDQLGLEKFYSYAGKNTGGGGTLMNNLYAGNTVWSYNAISNPSRGLSTFVRMSYNSLDTSDSVAGFGWSLQASSMMRLGTPLDFHPNPNPTKVTLTDGDGTSHWFTWDAATSEWKSPKGVHLYLQKNSPVDCKPNTQERKAWVLTKPDRTQFFYDCEGFLSSTVDNNGNEMVFTYEERKSNNKPTKFLKYITDPTGRITLTLDYYTKGQSYEYINDTTWTRTSATNLTVFPFRHARSRASYGSVTWLDPGPDSVLTRPRRDSSASCRPKAFTAGRLRRMPAGGTNICIGGRRSRRTPARVAWREETDSTVRRMIDCTVGWPWASSEAPRSASGGHDGPKESVIDSSGRLAEGVSPCGLIPPAGDRFRPAEPGYRPVIQRPAADLPDHRPSRACGSATGRDSVTATRRLLSLMFVTLSWVLSALLRPVPST